MPCPIPVNSALRAAAVGSTHCRPVTVAGGQQSRGGLLLLRNRYRWCVWHTSRPSPARPGAAPGELSPQAASSAARFAELRSGWTEFVTRVYFTGALWVGSGAGGALAVSRSCPGESALKMLFRAGSETDAPDLPSSDFESQSPKIGHNRNVTARSSPKLYNNTPIRTQIISPETQ